MAEDQATEGVPSRSGSPAGKRLTPWSMLLGRRLMPLVRTAQLVSHKLYIYIYIYISTGSLRSP